MSDKCDRCENYKRSLLSKMCKKTNCLSHPNNVDFFKPDSPIELKLTYNGGNDFIIEFETTKIMYDMDELQKKARFNKLKFIESEG